MEIVAYTQGASCMGTLKMLGGDVRSEDRARYFRLEQALNNPRMFFRLQDTASPQIIVHNAIVVMESGEKTVAFERDWFMIEPHLVELIYVVEPVGDSAQKPPKTTYEQSQAEKHRSSVEIITSGQKRLCGSIEEKFLAFSNQKQDQRFFAMNSVCLEIFSAKDCLTETLDRIYVNREFVRFFRETP